MDHAQEMVDGWSKDHLAGVLEGEASKLKTSNQPIYPTKQLVYAMERAAKLLRE